ncbi:MAG: nif-specific transcriptional activator NifA, partial [Nitrospira sp.]|nr:nif-specific transcriptional activator NifA [Nitrospira sp.]
GLSKEQQARGRFKIGEGITGRVFKTGEPMIIPDIGKEPLFLNRTKSRGDIGRQNIAFLCIPVKVHGETIGVLSVDRIFAESGISFEEDLRVLTIVASLIGQAVKLTQIVEDEKKSLIQENIHLQQELKAKYRLANIVGISKRMMEVYEAVERVSGTRATVLLRGESGTGKELIARAIHYNSLRATGSFIKLNCAALPETLLESELFGHEKGAFTGATQTRQGRFELANGGTLFLDEIGDIPLSIQVKLLRVLQETRFERVGGDRTIEVDVRLIAATHRDLEKAVREGIFREDLYYRLNVVPIFLPALRERKEDIGLLTQHFLQKFNIQNHKQVKLDPTVVEMLTRYEWPGNVRELENCIERMVVMTASDTIHVEDAAQMTYFLFPAIQEQTKVSVKPSRDSLPKNLEHIEREQIIHALEKYGWVQARAARLLGMTPRQIAYKMKKYKIATTPSDD